MERALKEKLRGGKFHNVKPAHRRIMQAVRGKGNRTTEARLRAALTRAGIRGWTVNVRKMKGSPDFFFPQKTVAVFVDGCFWHGCPICGHVPRKNSAFWEAKIARNQERDIQRGKDLKKRGIIVLRFWEHELTNSLGECVEKVRRLLSTAKLNGNPVK